jgi:hypothetical protein
MTDNRIAELLQLAEEEGLVLPYPPETIIAFEDQGAVVDLTTGAIYPGLADAPLGDVLTEVEGALLAVAGG